jgi:hypothetical protein
MEDLIKQARRWLKRPYWNRAPRSLERMPNEEPADFGCTEFVVLVRERVLGPGTANMIEGAHATWSSEALDKIEDEDALAGDLAFYTRPGDPIVGDPFTGPGGAAESWHVMMVVNSAKRIIGACPLKGEVVEMSAADYAALGWTRKGFRRVPLLP